MRDLVGSDIGKYHIISVLGTGGMATVYRARQASMGRDVAIKVVPTDAGAESATLSQRFEREVHLIALLQHPRILPVYDYGQTPEFTYLAMRLVETGTLANRLESGALDLEQTAHILSQLAAALDYAHQNDIIHRDLKPSNVFLDTQYNVYLADFGIAKLLGQVDTQLTSTGYVLGTPAYMSPEQAIDQPIDGRADVYALGLILFEMLTGRQVFSGSSALSIILKHINETPPLPSSLATHLTPEIDAVVAKALAKSPDDRYQSAGELSTAFSGALQSMTQFQLSAIVDRVANPTSRPISAVQPAAQPSPSTRDPQHASTPVQAADTHSLSTTGVPTKPTVNRRLPAWLWIGGGVLVGGGMLLTIAAVVIAVLGLRNGWSQSGTQDQETTPTVSVVTAFTPTPTSTVTETAETTAPTPVQAAPIVTPTVTPTATLPSVPPAGTPTPLPQPTVIPEATSELSTQRVGTVRFSSTNARLDTIAIQLSTIQAASPGKHYEGWLVGDTGSLLNVGTLVPDGNGNVEFLFTDSEGHNLAALYPAFRLSLEPDFGDAPEISQEIILQGEVNDSVVPFVREAILRASDTPLHSLLDGLETEAALGLDHMAFGRQDLANGNLAGGLSHIEHAINILVGSQDERFGDKNGDSQVQNPGDGYGLFRYLNALQTTAIAAGQADPTSAELALHVGFVRNTTQNALQRTDGIVKLLERCFIQDSTASTLALVDQAVLLYDELLYGFDANSNGTVEPIEGEGGLSLVTQHIGYLANIELYRVQTP